MVNVEFIGRLGADCEVLTSAKGNPYLRMRVATDEFKSKGERETAWMSVTYAGDRAVHVKEYLTKGKMVQVRGTERITLYTTKSGEPAYSRDVIADRVDFVSTGQQQKDEQQQEKPKQQTEPEVAKVESVPVQSTVTSDSDDDLPF